MVSVREILFGLFLTIASAIGGLSMIRDNFDAIESVKWTKHRGQIVTAEITRGGRGGYQAEFFYSYKVNQKSFVNSRIAYAGGDGKLETATKLIEKYPLFSDIDVFVKPDDPEKAVVEPGFAGTWFDCLSPAIIFACGLFLLFSNYRKFKKPVLVTCEIR